MPKATGKKKAAGKKKIKAGGPKGGKKFANPMKGKSKSKK